MTKLQLELGFHGVRPFVPPIRNRRLTRARRWFNRMHAVVNCARDWKPAPPARPEQTYLTLTRHRSR
jgi:hypothetical protein